MTTATIARSAARILQGQAASDGGGVRLTRVVSPNQGLDPFLLLDEFDSAEASDYIAGFPAHPHRGFETVTYMLDGHMRHEDHLGNRGELVAGGVQWMTAGRGIVHSEMPQQVEGRMRGFQLWINLPAREKMKPAGYRDLAPAEIPTVAIPGGRVRVVAGTFTPEAGHGASATTEPAGAPSSTAVTGPIVGPVVGGATDPLYFDVALDAGATARICGGWSGTASSRCSASSRSGSGPAGTMRYSVDFDRVRLAVQSSPSRARGRRWPSWNTSSTASGCGSKRRVQRRRASCGSFADSSGWVLAGSPV